MASTVIAAQFTQANISPATLAAIRVAQVERINAAADRAMMGRNPESIGIPASLFSAGIFLVAHGYDGPDCAGEFTFGVGLNDYRRFIVGMGQPALAEAIEAGRKAIFEGRRPILEMNVELSERLERMVQIQMEAYPSGWTEQERRESANDYLFGKGRAA